MQRVILRILDKQTDISEVLRGRPKAPYPIAAAETTMENKKLFIPNVMYFSFRQEIIISLSCLLPNLKPEEVLSRKVAEKTSSVNS